MNANVINYSAENFRRVDLIFICPKGEEPRKIQTIMVDTIRENKKVLDAPEQPFARLSGSTNETMEFTTRAWCKTKDYWDVYFDLTQSITEACNLYEVTASVVQISKEV